MWAVGRSPHAGDQVCGTFRGKTTSSPPSVSSTRGSPSASRHVKGGNVISFSPGYCRPVLPTHHSFPNHPSSLPIPAPCCTALSRTLAACPCCGH